MAYSPIYGKLRHQNYFAMIINTHSIPHAKRISDDEYEVEYWDLSDNAKRHYYITLQNQSYYCSNYDVYVTYIEHPKFLRETDLEKTLPIHVMNDAREGRTIIAIELSFDSYYDLVDAMYEMIVKYNLPSKQMLLISASEDLPAYIIERGKQLNIEPFNYEYYCSMEHTIQRSIMLEFDLCRGYNELVKPNIKSPLLNNRFPKKFLNLNRLWREHKIALLMLLIERNLLADGHVSFSKMDNWDIYYDRVNKCFPAINADYNIVDNLPLVLDTNRFESYDLTYFKRSLLPFYNETYFSVVNETHYNEKFPFTPTEKIYKAILHKHPFIVFGVPNYLSKFKNRGYKTFDGIIDESYDTETNVNIRILKIANEIERLCNLNQNELEEFRKKALEIVEYNFEVLTNKKDFIKKLL